MSKDKTDEFYSPVPKVSKIVLAASLAMALLFAMLYCKTAYGWMQSVAITFGMIAYHIIIRFLSPLILTALFHKRYNYKSRWFRQKRFEPKLYKLLKVKKWKGKAFTYDPSEFSTKAHSLEEIVNNMCHAELVHELIVLLSFTSLAFVIPFGAFWAFFITAVLAALFDMTFVVLQRFNRPRVVKLMQRNADRTGKE